MQRHFRFMVVCVVVLLAGFTAAAYVYDVKVNGHSQVAVERPASPAVATAEVAKEKLTPSKIIQPTYNIVYVESDQDNSVIWSASPDSPLSNRRSVIALSHAHGYPPQSSLSPTGDFIAYSLLAEGNSPAFNGTLWMVSLKGQDQSPRLIDKDVDYGWVPKWSNDGASFMYIKKIPLNSRDRYNNEIHIGNIQGETRLLSVDEKSLEVVPVGWNPAGDGVYVDRIDATGDTLYEIDTESGRVKSVARISDGAAWNLTLSPDGKQVLGSIQTQKDKPGYSLISVSTETGVRQTLLAGGARHYTAIWDARNGKITTNVPTASSEQPERVAEIGSKQPGKQIEASAVMDLQGEWSADKRIPLSWSPDGKWLALESHRGSFVDLGIARPSDGFVSQASSGYWTSFVGWTTAR